SSGNTTGSNSNGITADPAPTSPRIIVWNWTWNCKDDPPPLDLSELGPDTTTVVINWKWSCDDATPPPLQVASVTQCTSCNINISVRVASPGDSASVVQSTRVDAAAIASTVSEATQAAAQSVL